MEIFVPTQTTFLNTTYLAGAVNVPQYIGQAMLAAGVATTIPRRRVSAAPNTRLPLPNRALQRKVMASPFTATLSLSHTIATPRLWPSILATGTATAYQLGGQYFSYLRAGAAQKRGVAAFDELFVKFNNVNYGDSTSDNGYCVSLIHNGTAIEFGTKGLGGACLARIDDEWISLTPTSIPANGGENFYYINFVTAKPRRVDFYATTAPFSGVYTAATDTIMPAPVRGPRCIVMGDSFTEGTGATGAGLTDYVCEFASAMGWDDVWASGVGSTGYLAAPAPKINYRARVAGDVIAYSPEVVLLTGGYNDSAFTAEQIGAEAQLLVSQLKAGLPTATIVMVAPWWVGGAATMSKLILDQTTALRAVAQANGCVWISLTEIAMQNGVQLQNTTLSAAAAAAATSLSVAAPLSTNSTYAFPDGTRFLVKAITGTGPYTVTTDSGIQTAQANGAKLTQVGGSLWQGNGRTGATTGFGNADLFVGADGVHPTQAGHQAIGQTLATALMAALAPTL